MTKEFATWVSELSGTIEDTSAWIKPSYDITTLTPLQRRMHIADLLVPVINKQEDVDDWVTSFCVALDEGGAGFRFLTETSLASLIGRPLLLDYIDTSCDSSSKAWLNVLKDKIIKNQIERP
jgi:hypothetical protein